MIYPVTRQPVHLSTPESVACTAAGHCILAGTVDGSYQSAALVTADGGTSWHPASRWLAQTPASPSPEAPVVMNCPTVTRCVAIADYVTLPGGVELVGDDGGSSWRVVPVAEAVTGLVAVTCAGAARCLALSTDTVHKGIDLGSFVLRLVGTLGTASWRVAAHLPLAWRVQGITCTSPKRCLIAAVDATASAPNWRGRILESSDGSAHWRLLARSPDNYQALDAISCPTPVTCVGVGSGPPSNGAGIVSSAGAHGSWIARVIPRDIGNLYAIACTSPEHCVAVGTRRGSPAALDTLDDGRSWSASKLPAFVLANASRIDASF